MPEQIDSARIFAWWCTALPDRIVAKARPVKLERGVLFVHVASSAWAQELHHMAADLMGRLRAAQPTVTLRLIRFRVGELPELPRPRKERKPSRTPAVPMAALPDDLGRALATVGDDDVRRAVAKAATTSLTSRRSRE